MKTWITIIIMAVLMLTALVNANAQSPQGRNQSDRPEGMRPPPPPPEEIAADMLLEFDLDGDSKLDELELEEAIAARHQPPTPEDIAAKWTEEFDADGNGELSPEELAEALVAHQPPHGPHGPQADR